MVDKADTVMHVFTVSKSATSKALNELREAYRRVLKWDEEDWWTRIRELKSMNMDYLIAVEFFTIHEPAAVAIEKLAVDRPKHAE